MAAISARRAPVIELMKNRARTWSIRPACRRPRSRRRSRRSSSSRADPALVRAAARARRGPSPARRPARGAEPDRAGGARRRARGGARGAAPPRGGGLPGGADPAADGAGRHRAAALRLHRAHPDDRDVMRLADLVRTRRGGRGMTAVFLTATGTDIGKTFVAPRHDRRVAGDAGAASRRSSRSISGFDARSAPASDPTPAACCSRSGYTTDAGARSPRVAVAAPRAAAPDMAARREGTAARFRRRSRRTLPPRDRGHRDALLIEGIGGVMVPLDDRHTVLDWMIGAATCRCCSSPAAISARSATPSPRSTVLRPRAISRLPRWW